MVPISRKLLVVNDGRIKVVVIIPVAMKVRTAASDLILNLAKPQMPWPLVQPFPSFEVI